VALWLARAYFRQGESWKEIALLCSWSRARRPLIFRQLSRPSTSVQYACTELTMKSHVPVEFWDHSVLEAPQVTIAHAPAIGGSKPCPICRPKAQPRSHLNYAAPRPVSPLRACSYWPMKVLNSRNEWHMSTNSLKSFLCGAAIV
jgi:hypothetical protein